MTSPGLDTSLHIADPDGFYEQLIDMHEGLSTEQSHRLNARLVLLMANQIGDRPTLDRLIEAARDGVTPPAGEPDR